METFTNKADDKTRFINRVVNSLNPNFFNLLDFMCNEGRKYNNKVLRFKVSNNFYNAFNIPYYTDFSEYYNVINPSIVAISYKKDLEGLNLTIKQSDKNILTVIINN